ncbi:MAG TPA: FtsX-like permease family protein [Thermoanaerobaculia bacterium]|nr:FtsX-like permease family protein [Thermoanaerobaculia bacterium]
MRLDRGTAALVKALILRPILRERGRTLITIAGIAIGVAVLVAIQLSNESALRAFGESVESVAGRANFQIVSDSGPLDERVLLALQPLWSEGVRFAPVIDLDGLIEPSQIPIRILAVDLLSDLHFRDYRYAKLAVDKATDSAPSANRDTSFSQFLALFSPDSLVVPERFARERALTLGSRVAISAGGIRSQLVVRGTLHAEGPATAFNGSLAILDIAAAQRSFGMRGKLTRIDLLIPEARVAYVLPQIQKSLNPSMRVERPARRNERVGKMLRAFRINLFALAGVALLVGTFLVYNTVLISILRRRRDVGILKTVGVSSRQIFFAFIGEGALFGLIGSLAGLGLGYALSWSTLDLIGRTINALYVSSKPETIDLSWPLVVIAMGVGTVVSVISSILPALEAAAIRPGALIRSGIYQRLASRDVKRLAGVALCCFALAAAACFVPSWSGIAVGGYISVLLLITGFSLLSPLAIESVSRFLAPSLTRWFGPAGRLAAVSLPASLRRTAVASAALSVAIGMMIAVSLMVGSFRETVRVWVDQTIASDLWLRPARGLASAPSAVFPAAILDDLTRFDFIEAADPVRGRDMVYRDSIIAVGSGDFRIASVHSNLPMVKPRRAREALVAAIRSNGVFISESFSIKFKKDVGDVVELPLESGVVRFPITGIYRDYSNDRGVVVMDRPLYISQFHDSSISSIAIFLRKGTDPEAARRQIEDGLGKKYRIFGFTNGSIRTEVMKIFDQTFLITYALLVVALVVAILGIINTLSALILERTREIALLKVFGMSTDQLRTVVILESAILGITSTLVGVATGYALSVVLIYVINKQSFGWTIEFSPPTMLIVSSLAITFVTTLLAGLIPARYANRVNMASAMKGE